MAALPAIALSAGHAQASDARELLRAVPGGAAAGLYLPAGELAHAGHELTQKILTSKVSREHDPLLARLLAAVATLHFPHFKPDLVASVPPAPGREDRFRNIRSQLATETGATDAGPALTQTRVVADYRRMNLAQRRAASHGRCYANGSVGAKSVLLIDDVVTSGAQASDAIRALKAAGAGDVRFACVARSIGAPGDP